MSDPIDYVLEEVLGGIFNTGDGDSPDWLDTFINGLLPGETGGNPDGSGFDLWDLIPLVLGVGSAQGWFDGDKPKVGWQGTIDRKQAIREQVPGTNSNEYRMPGSYGQRYFTDVQYVDPNDPEAVAAAEAAAAEQAGELEQFNLQTAQNTIPLYMALANLYTKNRAAPLPEGETPLPPQYTAPPQAPAPAPDPGQGGTYPDDPTPNTPPPAGGDTPTPTPTPTTPDYSGIAAALQGLNLGTGGHRLGGADNPGFSLAAPVYNHSTGQYESAGAPVWTRSEGPTEADLQYLRDAGYDDYQTSNELLAKRVASAPSSHGYRLPDGSTAYGGQTIDWSKLGFNAGGPVSGIQGLYMGGATDGMADQRPATINQSTPAALSDGEFVVPADVVSHLGNGNSNAGANQLYRMMERVRKARTGDTKQGPRIDPNKLMPR